MPDQETLTAQPYYDRLTDSFLNHRNDEDAKCKEFRTVMDDFFHEYVVPGSTETDTWADLQKVWYERTWNKRVDRFITDLRTKLNKIVHGKMHVNGPNNLYTYFQSCVLVIKIVSGEQPDARTRAAIGEFDDSYLQDLNEQQRDIVLDRSRITYVNAGPGTGKTHLLVYKIVDILAHEENDAKIVALSYTRSSAASLTSKLGATVEKLHLLQGSLPYSGTIHSYCLNCMRNYREQKGQKFDYVIADDSEIEEIVDDIYYSFDGIYDRDCIKECFKNPDVIDVKHIIDSTNVGKKSSDESYVTSSDVDGLIKAVKERQNIYNRITVGEILHVYLKTLKEDDDFAKWCAERVNWLLVDEAQDLTVENYAIFDTLLERIPDLHLFLVGDPRQNIFEFLGGSFKNLNDFLEKYDGQISKKFLSYSYRCPQKILDFTNGMEFRDCDNIMLTSKSMDEGAIIVHDYEDDYEEARSVVKYIRERGDYAHTAILSSRLRDLSKIVDELNAHDISFTVKGGSKTVKPHIQAFACMNKIVETKGRALGPCNGICEKFEMPKCKVAPQFFATEVGKTIQSYMKSYLNYNISYLELSRKFVEVCRKYLPEGNREVQNEDFKKLYKMVIEKADSPESFSNIFKHYKGQFESLEVEFKSTGKSEESVTLSTIHSAKGLEWDCVVMPGMCDKYFPNPKTIESVDPEARMDAMNSARKLMFVAVTRARKTLLVTYATTLRDSRSQAGPSKLLGALALM